MIKHTDNERMLPLLEENSIITILNSVIYLVRLFCYSNYRIPNLEKLDN
jgi:hypothetical protein